jgi:glycosyltransferase involved in cell wall biosynthesis
MTFETLLRDQIASVTAAGFELTLVCSPGDGMAALAQRSGATYVAVPMARQLAPAADARSLAALVRLFRRERFDLVHSSTPKAGLLTALAARLAGVPLRLHTFTGQPWVELRGAMRVAARQADRTIARLDTHLYADSHSQRAFLIAEGIARADRLAVVGAGSISGVDLRRFDPAALAAVRGEVRARLGIEAGARVVVFVGRVTRDKGAGELIDAFAVLAATRPDLHLLLVGPLEPERDPLPAATLAAMEAHPRIHAVGFSGEPERYLAAADLFCLPSYREGFGTVAIEAGALGLPVVGTRVTGLVDAIVDGETGALVPAKDAAALATALGALLDDPAARTRLGAAGQKRARELFDAEAVNGAVAREYGRLLEDR